MNVHSQPAAELLKPLPALRAYLQRVDAEQRNFRRYVVLDPDRPVYGSLRKELATIRIANGEILCDNKDFAPTEEEEKAIKLEIASDPFPKSINVRKGALPPELTHVDRTHLSIFADSTGEEVVFVQYRKDGEKPDLPFSCWSDGEWRMMEPDGLLPLFGLDKLKDAFRLILHEGAKAARDVQRSLDEGREHPWREDLKDAAHLGWPGGAMNARRVDWSPIQRLPPTCRVTLVCDNDRPGIEAATEISRILKRLLDIVLFDDHFPATFDLADPWPKHPEWWRGDHYCGPSLDDLTVPGTWATDVITSGKQGRPSFRLRPDFAAEWLCVESPPVFIHRRQTDRLRTADVFNNCVRCFSDAEDTARLLVQKLSSQCAGLAYRPVEARHFAHIVNVDGARLVNVFRPPSIRPIKGDFGPWIRFMNLLIPEDLDRTELLRWCATLIAMPAIRMHYSVLLISETQGVGKTTLGDAILAPLVGRWNVSAPSEKEVVDSQFNGWIVRKRLVLIHEIYSGHSRKAYDKLKGVITDRTIDVNQKFLPPYSIENWAHVFACSNSLRALHLDNEDRRWLVPRVTEEAQNPAYWRELYRWINGDGLPIIAQWAEDFLKKNAPVASGAHAPMTAAKAEVIAESRSVGQQLAYDLGQRVAQQASKVVLAVDDVREWVAEQRNLGLDDNRLEKLLTLRKAMKAGGLKEPERFPGHETRRFQIEKKATKSHVVANFVIAKNMDWPAIKGFYRRPEEFMAL